MLGYLLYRVVHVFPCVAVQQAVPVLRKCRRPVSSAVAAMFVQLLLASPQVPSAMSHHVFWQRYFYRVRLLDIDEARKAELKQRADKLQSEKEQQLAWPDEKGSDRFDMHPTVVNVAEAADVICGQLYFVSLSCSIRRYLSITRFLFSFL